MRSLTSLVRCDVTSTRRAGRRCALHVPGTSRGEYARRRSTSRRVRRCRRVLQRPPRELSYPVSWPDSRATRPRARRSWLEARPSIVSNQVAGSAGSRSEVTRTYHWLYRVFETEKFTNHIITTSISPAGATADIPSDQCGLVRAREAHASRPSTRAPDEIQMHALV